MECVSKRSARTDETVAAVFFVDVPTGALAERNSVRGMQKRGILNVRNRRGTNWSYLVAD